MKRIFLKTALLSFLSIAAHAQMKPEMSVTGYLDAYYSYNFNDPQQTLDNTYRYYDTKQNQMTLNLAELTLETKAEEVSLLVDFDFGPFADLNATTAPAGTNQVDESSKNIGQAVLSYRPKNSRFQIDAGKMYSHMGLETVKPKDNFNYSRSILFSYLPFWHTGIRIGYDLIPSKVQTSFYMYNGWNTNNDVNRSKSFGAQIKWTPTTRSTIAYNYLGGPEKLENERDFRSVHDLNATVVLSDEWTIAADAIHGSEENATIGTSTRFATWYGALVMARYQFSPKTYLSPRYEYYRDEDGYNLGSGPQTINSVTLTVGKEMAQGLETRAELRSDMSNEKTFAGESTSEKEKTQTTASVALLVKF